MKSRKKEKSFVKNVEQKLEEKSIIADNVISALMVMIIIVLGHLNASVKGIFVNFIYL